MQRSHYPLSRLLQDTFLMALALLLFGFASPAARCQTFASLYTFTGDSHGGKPTASLLQATDGNLYGTTYSGGASKVGTVFKITTSGTLTTLYAFTGGSDGANPNASLIQASDGNLYGTTYSGGASKVGTVFKITTSGTLTTLYAFTGKVDGAYPYASLLQASDGNLYGTTVAGGASGQGTVFKITTGGTLTTLHSFTYRADGGVLRASLIQASDGNLYGTTFGGGASKNGTVFKITTGGTLTTLYAFTGGSDDGLPYAGLLQASDGNLYGTTYGGGASKVGTVFRITTSGTLTTLYTFTGGLDGGNPHASLLQASDGNLYGTTVSGGASKYGTVFKITTGGTLTTLYAFTGGSDGGGPIASLIQASDGNLYGTTPAYGGVSGKGTVFQLSDVVPAPTLISLSPNQATAGSSATTLTLTGTHFVSNSVAMWGTIALATTYVSATQLTAVIPASLLATAGTYAITVETPAGGTSSPLNFTVNNPTPTLTSISPIKVAVGSSDTTLTLTGTHFVSNSVAMWGTTALATTYVSATQLTTTVPASLLTATGTFAITVVNPAPGGGASSPLNVSVVTPNPVPTLSNLSLYQAKVGSSPITLTLIGTNFVHSSVAMWGTTALTTTYVSATKLTAVIPASLLTTAGTFAITVVSPALGGGTTAALNFSLTNPTPILSKLSTYQATVGSNDLTVSLYGSNFVSSSVAMWGTTPLTTTYVSATKLSAVIPASLLTATGTFAITIVNPAPGGGTSAALNFTVNNRVPTLIRLSLYQVKAGSTDTTLSLYGTNYVAGSVAMWGTTPLTTTYVSGAKLSAVIPASLLTTRGTFSITVVNPAPYGGTSTAITFTVN